jgi:hypothetical protein
MSSILEGADRAYLREYNESEDERRLGALKSALDSVQQETKNAGYIKNGLVLDIQLAVRRIYEDLGINVSDGSPYDKAEDAVRKATSDLESAIFSLDEQIKLEIREVNNSIDDARMDAEEMDENISGNKPASIDSEMDAYFGSKPGELEEEKQRLDPKCWDGYKKQGTKMKGGKKVNNCVPKESKSHIGQALSEMYDDHVYVLYIDGRRATSAPIAKKQKNELERVVKQALPNATVQFKAVPRQDYSADQLAEGTGKIRGAIAGILLLSGLLGLNNHQAQKMYDQSHQLQQLTQVYMVAKERQDVDKMKEVKRRISNHKTRIDLGKGDVDFDGRPGDDDIKDIDYLNTPE